MLAQRSGHQQLLPEHLLKVLIEDNEGLAAGLVNAAGGDAKKVATEVEAALAKLPKVEGSGAGQVYLSGETNKVFEQAEQAAKKAGDGYVTAERLLLALTLTGSLLPCRLFALLVAALCLLALDLLADLLVALLLLAHRVPAWGLLTLALALDLLRALLLTCRLLTRSLLSPLLGLVVVAVFLFGVAAGTTTVLGAGSGAHAEGQGLAIDYRAVGVEAIDGAFDLVTSMEVIEHVADPQSFIYSLAQRLAPGGLMILSTPNKTAWSKLLTITLAEGFGQIPRGTHDFEKFIDPDAMRGLLAHAGRGTLCRDQARNRRLFRVARP
jgi:SAM-dependent methyltransferase